jgi:hypothetical protein
LALKSNGGDDAVAPGGYGVVDDVQKKMAVSKTRTVPSIASRRRR